MKYYYIELPMDIADSFKLFLRKHKYAHIYYKHPAKEDKYLSFTILLTKNKWEKCKAFVRKAYVFRTHKGNK